MAKKAASRYQEGKRGGDWLKIKTHGRQEFVICGWTKGQGRRAGSFGSLVLGVREGKEYVWVGNVGTGFNEKTIDELLAKLRPLERETSPFAAVPKMPKVRKGDVVWVEPKLVCEVEFLEWTHDGHLRAPSFQGLRDDKSARAVRREEPRRRWTTARGLKLSNLDKLFWPDEGITKGDLIDYYRAVAPVLVPHLKGRPFTMRRYPDGAYGKAFFQKDAPKHMPDWIPRFAVEVSTRERPPKRRMIEAPLVNDERALLWMVNMGCIDMNAWYSRVDKPDRPDFVLFDLDPSPDVGIKEVVEVALLVKQALDALGLVSFPKTSSADGMHVLVPIERRSTYAQTREFCEIVAGAIARDAPRPRDDGVVEGEAPRRPHRREPERRGEDDRVGLLRPPAAGRAGLDAAALGRGDERSSTRRASRWTSCSSGSAGTATCSRACSPHGSGSSPRCAL